MTQVIDLYKSLADRYKKRKKYFDDYLKYAKEIKRKSQALLKEPRVLVFGSVVKGNYAVNSDIDVLIIVENIPESSLEQTKIKSEILQDFEDHPFELHLVTPNQYENWYKNFIKDDYIDIK